ncbi:hypothetical protein EBQ93_03450 [bacterium]|nr:hypothetical protein [bacterium]
MKNIILFLNIVWMGVVFAADGGGFAGQKAALPVLGAGLHVSERERSDGSVVSVGDLVKDFRRLGKKDEPARADDAATQSAQYSDAHSIPLDQFYRPKVGHRKRLDVVAGSQDDVSDVHSDDLVRQGLQRKDSLSSLLSDEFVVGKRDAPLEDLGHLVAADAEHDGSDVHSQSSARPPKYLELTEEQKSAKRARVTVLVGDQLGDVDPRKKE